MTPTTALIIALIGIALTILTNLLTAVYVYGKLVQTVSDQSRRIGVVEADTRSQQTQINGHAERISAVEGALGHQKLNGKAQHG
jgi:hypothetical protein